MTSFFEPGNSIDPVAACDLAANEARAVLREEWAQTRVRLGGDIEAAILEVCRSFESSTTVKIGGSVVAVVGGVASVIGFAMLLTSLGGALPLAIAGTIAAIGGGVGGGAASVRHAALQFGIAKRIRENFEASRRLMDELLDQLVVTLLTQAKRAVQLYNKDVGLSCQVYRLLGRLLVDLRQCVTAHSRLLCDAGMSSEAVAALPAAECAARLVALVAVAHNVSMERMATEFIDVGSQDGPLMPEEQPGAILVEEQNEVQTAECAVLMSQGAGNGVLRRRACASNGRRDAIGGEEEQTGGQKGRPWQGVKVGERVLGWHRSRGGTMGHHYAKAKLNEAERDRLTGALNNLSSLLMSLIRVSLFGSADVMNMPCGEEIAVSLKATLHSNIDLAEGFVQSVGKASALSVAHILGSAVGSAASTVVDVGLLIYYSKQLHDFRRNKHHPQLAEQLQTMKLTVQLQLAEVLSMCCVECDQQLGEWRVTANSSA